MPKKTYGLQRNKPLNQRAHIAYAVRSLLSLNEISFFYFGVYRSSFYKMRAERIEWFAKRDPFATEIQELLDIGVFLPLKEKDENGCQIFVIRTGVHSTKKHQQNDVLKVIDRISVDISYISNGWHGYIVSSSTFRYDYSLLNLLIDL